MRILDLKTMQECEINDDTVVALGTFDGCHLGHQSVFQSACLMAKKLKVKAVAYTFDTVPRASSEHSVKSILTLDEKIKFISQSQIDYIAIDDFSDVKNMDGADFVSVVLKGKLNAIGVACGYNYHFGKGAEYSSGDLPRFFEKGEESVDICPKVSLNNTPISSTLIREKIKNGDVEKILALCPPYSVCSQVVEGKRLGRTIGAPTINQIIPNEKIVPKKGVYITECEIGDNIYPSVTNVGVRPTVEGNGSENMETHIIGYNGNLYHSYVRVNFYKRLRDEIKFSSLDELRKQIFADIEASKAYFK